MFFILQECNFTVNQFSLVATGGTFDIIHQGHLALLKTAFDVSKRVIIGLTSDEFAVRMGKTTHNTYDRRYNNLHHIITTKFPESAFDLVKLDNDFDLLSWRMLFKR